MKKTFTIHQISRSNVSEERGSMSWLLSDEDGYERKVNSITTLDRNGAIIAAKAIFGREVPLVEALWLRSEGETFDVDFTGFNETHGYTYREVYSDMRSHERLAGLGKQVGWLFTALLLAGVVWLGWAFYDSMNALKNQQPIRTHELP
jgi:hypothetical protein